MNITNELNGLLKEYNFKKDVLDNHTTEIVKGIRDWCIAENDRINKEFNSIINFFNSNYKEIIGLMNYNNGAYRWSGLVLKMDSDKNYIATIGLDNDYMYKAHFGSYWSNLPKPIKHFTCNDFTQININCNSLDYWTDCKKALDIRNETLCEVMKQCKNYMGTLILNQQKRCDDMVKAVKDIEQSNTETIEIKVEIRKQS